MDTLQIIAHEQQAICLVALGLLSLAVAFSFRRFVQPGKAATGMRQAFWLSQAILGSSGLAVLVWPSYGWAAITAAVIGCGLLVLWLDRVSPLRKQRSGAGVRTHVPFERFLTSPGKDHTDCRTPGAQTHADFETAREAVMPEYSTAQDAPVDKSTS